MHYRVVEKDLRKMQVGRRYKGYMCVLHAVDLSIRNEEYLWHVTKELYPKIAECMKTNRKNVEHDIRYLITKCWENNPAYLCEIAGYPLDRPPTSREFIEILVNHELRETKTLQKAL